MRKKLLIGVGLFLGLAAIGHYVPLLTEETYPEEAERLETYLEETHDLQIEDGFVYESGRTTNGVEAGDLIGVFYDKRDPSFMIQMAIDKDDGAIMDHYDKKTFGVRQEILQAMHKHKKGNDFNGYVHYFPDGIVGPALTSKSYGEINPAISYSVIRDKIDREKEIESDYKFLREVDQLSRKHYGTPLNVASVAYFERNDFNFNVYLEAYKKKFGKDIYGNHATSSLTVDEPERLGIKDSGKAKWVMEYQVSTFEKGDHKLNLHSFEEFKAEVMKSSADHKKHEDSFKE